MRTNPRSMLVAGRHGLTVLELVVALGILSVILTASVPSIGSLTRAARLRTASLEIYAELQKTRALAITENNQHRFYVVPGSDRLYAIHDDDDNDGVEDAGESIRIRDVHSYSPRATLAASGTVTFRPNGATLGPATIQLIDGDGPVQVIEVAPAGRIRVR